MWKKNKHNLIYLKNLNFHKLIIKKLFNTVKEKKLVIFDIGCYRGFFTKTFLKSIKIKNYKFYLFDINKNVKRYILKLRKFLIAEIWSIQPHPIKF